MKINRHNYEAYLLDQLEGSLSVDDQRELEQFLRLNPDCAPGLEELEPMVLTGEKLIFKNSELLKKEFPDHSSVLDDHNFDMFSIARMEGDLNPQQIQDHQFMLEADRQKAVLWKQWQQTRLVAESLAYPYKEQLKHRSPLKSRVLWISVVSAAAAVALLLVLFRSGLDQPQPELITQASQEEVYSQEQLEPVESEAAIRTEEPVSVKEIADAGALTKQVQVEQTQNSETAQEPAYLQETSQPEETGDKLELQPRVHALSENLFPTASVISKAEHDRIQALQIDPVPVHLRSLTLAQISDIGFQEVLEEYAEDNNLTLWKIANAGIKGINKLAGSDISLLASRDEEGDISGYRLKSKRFSLTRPVGAEQ